MLYLIILSYRENVDQILYLSVYVYTYYMCVYIDTYVHIYNMYIYTHTYKRICTHIDILSFLHLF